MSNPKRLMSEVAVALLLVLTCLAIWSSSHRGAEQELAQMRARQKSALSEVALFWHPSLIGEPAQDLGPALPGNDHGEQVPWLEIQFLIDRQDCQAAPYCEGKQTAAEVRVERSL